MLNIAASILWLFHRSARFGIGAALVVVAMTMSTRVQAAVITNTTSIAVPPGPEGLYINLVTKATGRTASSVPGWHINFYGEASTSPGAPPVLAVTITSKTPANTAGSSGVVSSQASTSTVCGSCQYVALTTGALLGPSSIWYAGNGSAYLFGNLRQYPGVKTIGLRFFNETTGALNYGYLTIKIESSDGYPATVLGWAYENSGGPITYPGTPATLSPLAAAAGWRQTPYEAADIAAGADGNVWFTTSSGAIYHVTSSGPVLVPGAATRLTVDPNGVPWLVNASNSIYRRNGAAWEKMPGTAYDIGAGGNKVWILGSSYIPAYWNGTGWTPLTGAPTNPARIAVDPSGNPWIVRGGAVHRWNGTAWQQVPGGAALRDISVGGDGTAYAVGLPSGSGGGQVYRMDAGATGWAGVPGVLGNAVGAGPAGRAYVARDAGYPVLSK